MPVTGLAFTVEREAVVEIVAPVGDSAGLEIFCKGMPVGIIELSDVEIKEGGFADDQGPEIG